MGADFPTNAVPALLLVEMDLSPRVTCPYLYAAAAGGRGSLACRGQCALVVRSREPPCYGVYVGRKGPYSTCKDLMQPRGETADGYCQLADRGDSTAFAFCPLQPRKHSGPFGIVVACDLPSSAEDQSLLEKRLDEEGRRLQQYFLTEETKILCFVRERGDRPVKISSRILYCETLETTSSRTTSQQGNSKLIATTRTKNKRTIVIMTESQH